MDFSIGITLLLALMGIVFTGAQSANFVRRQDFNYSFDKYLRNVRNGSEQIKARFKYTWNMIQEYEETNRNLTNAIGQTIENSNGMIMTIPWDFWNVIREWCSAIGSKITDFSVSSSSIANIQNIFTSGKFTNFDEVLATKYMSYQCAELVMTLISQGVHMNGYRIYPTDAYPNMTSRVTMDLSAYYLVFPIVEDGRLLTDSNGNRYYEPRTDIEIDVRVVFQSESSYSGDIATFIKGTNTPIRAGYIKISSVNSRTIDEYMQNRFLADNVKSGSISSTNGRCYSSSSNWAIAGITKEYYDKNGFALEKVMDNGTVIEGEKIDAGVLSDVYNKVNDIAGTGALGDVITPGRVIDDTGVIHGPVSVEIPQSWATTYPDIATLQKSLADALAKINAYPWSATDNKVVEKTDNPAVDKLADKTAEDIIQDELENPNPVTPPVIPPPTIGISSSGFITLFNPTMSKLSALNDVLWSEDFVTNFRKAISNPIDGIISLLAVPINPPTSGSKNVRLGNYESGISMRKVSNQYGTLSCGAMSITEHFHNYMDYAPYTKVCIYLPFIGFVNMNTNEVMNSKISVTYNIDFLTGACMAQVAIGKTGLTAVGYVYTGNMGMQLPITGANYSRFYSSVIQSAGVVAGSIATGGAATVALASMGAALNTAQAAGGDIQKSGGISGNAGFLGEFTPYVIITRPKPNNPNNYNSIEGFLANTTLAVSAVHGYGRVKEIHLSGIPATSGELAEIESLLKSGIDF